MIVSPPEIHDHLSIVMVAPMTTGSHAAAFRVPVRFRRKDGLILPEQSRALDKRRLVRRLGLVDGATLAAVLAVFREMFAE